MLRRYPARSVGLHGALGLALVALLSARPAVGQRLSSALPSLGPSIRVRSSAFSVPESRLRYPPPARPRTYWLEGGSVGGIGLGVFGALHGLCADSDVQHNCTGSTLGVGVLGAGVGFTVGALIGGQFRKGAVAPR
jgi:hypothetical protein